jgi:hypothetical protein
LAKTESGKKKIARTDPKPPIFVIVSSSGVASYMFVVVYTLADRGIIRNQVGISSAFDVQWLPGPSNLIKSAHFPNPSVSFHSKPNPQLSISV